MAAIEVDANEAISIYQRKLSEAHRENVILEAQCNQLMQQLADSANDKMIIKQLELQVEELQAQEGTPT